jgi:hypothetical protein
MIASNISDDIGHKSDIADGKSDFATYRRKKRAQALFYQ